MIELLGITPEHLQGLELLPTDGVIRIVEGALGKIDSRLVGHGHRVAFIVHEMMSQSGRYSQEEIILVCQMAMFHDVGAYKTDEIDNMFTFESEGVMPHSVYGYLFLKFFTPLGEGARSVLYHHYDFCKRPAEANDKDFHYSQLIHLADRVDIIHNSRGFVPQWLQERSGTTFDPALVELFLATSVEKKLIERLDLGEYMLVLQRVEQQLASTVEVALAYISMLVYVIDFKSEFTVNHTLNTIAFSVLVSRLMGMSEPDQYKIYLGALLHDIGKIAIPSSVLENPGKLSLREMQIMQTHVVITDDLLLGNVSTEIRHIAARHHEKLDGRGYPDGLTAGDLTQSERIVAVGDILSALVGQRSYKDSFSKEKTIEIIMNMSKAGQLDPAVCRMVAQHFDELRSASDGACAPLIATYRELRQQYDELLGTMTKI